MAQTQGEVRHIRPPTDIELAAIVRNFHTARVLVVGDVILDRYVSGAVHRLSPEAPIPVLTARNQLRHPGRRGERRSEYRDPGRPSYPCRCNGK